MMTSDTSPADKHASFRHSCNGRIGKVLMAVAVSALVAGAFIFVNESDWAATARMEEAK